MEAEEVIGLAVKCGSLYYSSCQMQETVNAVTNQNRIKVWHQCYGHLNVTSLRKLANDQLVKGLSCSDVSDEMDLCESCVQRKIHRTPFASSSYWRQTSRSTTRIDSH